MGGWSGGGGGEGEGGGRCSNASEQLDPRHRFSLSRKSAYTAPRVGKGLGGRIYSDWGVGGGGGGGGGGSGLGGGGGRGHRGSSSAASHPLINTSSMIIFLLTDRLINWWLIDPSTG